MSIVKKSVAAAVIALFATALLWQLRGPPVDSAPSAAGLASPLLANVERADSKRPQQDERARADAELLLDRQVAPELPVGATTFIVTSAEDAKPCQDAAIAMHHGGVSLPAEAIIGRTDARGQCAVKELGPGSRCIVIKPGFVPSAVTVMSPTVKVQLSQGQALRVLLVDQNDLPLDGVSVELSPVEPSEEERRHPWPGVFGSRPGLMSAKTDQKGEAELRGLADGRYFLHVSHESLVSPTDPIALDLPAPQPFRVAMMQLHVAMWTYDDPQPIETYWRMNGQGGIVEQYPARLLALQKTFPTARIVATRGVSSEPGTMQVDAFFGTLGQRSHAVAFTPLSQLSAPQNITIDRTQPVACGSIILSLSGTWFDARLLDLCIAPVEQAKHKSPGRRRFKVPIDAQVLLPVGRYELFSPGGLVEAAEFEVLPQETTTVTASVRRDICMLHLAVFDEEGRAIIDGSATTSGGLIWRIGGPTWWAAPLPVGRHKLTVTARGYSPANVEIAIAQEDLVLLKQQEVRMLRAR